MVEIAWPQSGELTRRVIIKHWIDYPNDVFGITQEMSSDIQRWARIDPVNGAAFIDNENVEEKMTHKIWLRWGTGSKPEDITRQHVVDYPLMNQRFRVLNTINVGDAQRFTLIEVKLLGIIL